MKTLAHVETPAVVVDLARLDANLGRWQAHCGELGLTSRPHVKTHKCIEIARRQVAMGATGITCQTLFEAETMVAAGIDDVLIPFNIVGETKLARLGRLLRRASVAVSVDDEALLPGLSRAAADGGRSLGVLVDCDTGLGRTGVGTPAAAAALARAVAVQPGLRYLGLITYPALPAASAFLAEAAALAELSGLATGVIHVDVRGNAADRDGVSGRHVCVSRSRDRRRRRRDR